MLHSSKNQYLSSLFAGLLNELCHRAKKVRGGCVAGGWQIAISVCYEAEQNDMGSLLIPYVCSMHTFAKDSQ